MSDSPGPSSQPKPGPSTASDSRMNSIAVVFPDDPKPKASKLEQLTNDQIDKYISSETLAQYEFSGDRHMLIFDLHHVEDTPAVENTEDLDEEFFELSKGEAHRLLRDIIRTRDRLENGALMTKAMRDLDAAKRTLTTLHQYNYSVIRLHFPDGLVVQALFKPLENIGKVKAYLRQFLQSPEMEFYIYLTPPKMVLQDSSTLLDLRCVPTGNFYFGAPYSCEGGLPEVSSSSEGTETTNEGATVKASEEAPAEGATSSSEGVGHSLRQVTSVENYLKPDVVTKSMVTRSVADAKAAEFRRARNPALNFMDDESDLSSVPSSAQSPQPTPAMSKANRPRTSQDKIPKWFKPGGK